MILVGKLRGVVILIRIVNDRIGTKEGARPIFAFPIGLNFYAGKSWITRLIGSTVGMISVRTSAQGNFHANTILPPLEHRREQFQLGIKFPIPVSKSETFERLFVYSFFFFFSREIKVKPRVEKKKED